MPLESGPDDPQEPLHALGLFHAGLPPFMLFAQDVNEVTKIVLSYSEMTFPDVELKLNPAANLGIIGIVAYFEAFCKHQFAALMNIAPELLVGFSEKRPQAALPLRDLAIIANSEEKMFGFAVAERFDFGSGKQVNNLFKDLLSITPFTNDEVQRMESLLNARHLLVHHGGIFTLNYAREHNLITTDRGGVYFDSVNFSCDEYVNWKDFLGECAKKLVTVSTAALSSFISSNGLHLPPPNQGAIERIDWGLDGFCGLE